MESPHSLLKLSHLRPGTEQPDGWGIVRVVGTGGAYEPSEEPKFRAAAHRAHGPVIVGHLRRASNPMHRPASELIGAVNSQPFTDNSYLFVHNGT